MTPSNSLKEIGSRKSQSQSQSQSQIETKKGGGRFENLAVPFGYMLLSNNHSPMQKYAIDMNSSRTMKIDDPLYDSLLEKVSK